MSDSQLLVTDVMSQPLASANVLVESAVAVASKSVILSQAPFTLNEYVSFLFVLLSIQAQWLDLRCKLHLRTWVVSSVSKLF